MDRRHFFQLSVGATAATLLMTPKTQAQTSDKIELHAWTAHGAPMPQKVMAGIYFLDLNDEPFPNPPRRSQDGKLWTDPPAFPFAIALNLSVLGFGDVTLYADNQGKGYRPSDFPLNLNLACAQTRIHRVKEAIATWQTQGYQPSNQVLDQLEHAALKYQRATTESAPKSMAAWANESLRDSLWAGETAVFEQARQTIARRGSRPDFLFGANCFGHPDGGEKYDRQFEQLFNFATLPFYWKSFEPTQGKPNFARIDRTLTWLNQANITPKGHPLVWLHEAGVPDWVKNQPYDSVRKLVRERVTEITRYFGDRISYYDIINEAHDIDWSNTLNYSQAQFIELTQLASEASAIGYPQIQRIVNTCCSWARYVAREPQIPPLRSAYQYLKACIDADIPFEIIGIQLYYPSQDMFEIHRLLERFSRFGKPIHITELGVSSSIERDEKSYFKTASGLWHQPWSETIQADWIEQFYTLCYSKPYIQAITWWDFADANFWPHGGFLRRDMIPKESFFRLQKLRNQWRS